VALAAGVDASPEWIARARWCSSRLPNTCHEVAEGHDLSAFDDASFQLVYAVDPSPSLVSSRDARVKRLFAEVARVLAPSGAFVIVEPAPRPSARDASRELEAAGELGAGDLERRALDHGFELVAKDERPFRHPDAVCYRMRRRG
jgi:SAM-dependent methyltransferase